MKTFEVKTPYSYEPECVLVLNKYANNQHIALSVWCEDGPFADITVNLPETKRYPKNFGFVDTNNFPQAHRLIEQLGIGKPTGTYAQSGWCYYPLYEFDIDKIKEWTEGEEQ